MINFITHNLLWSQGINLCIIAALGIALGIFLWRPLLYVSLIFFVFCFYFFRNPERVCAAALDDASVLVCPADGKVVHIQFDPQKGFDGYEQKVSIFLSPLDVHVNWVPAAGTIEKVTYHAGKFVPAFLPKSSELNERNDILLRTQHGKHIVVRQIAGTIARTICCWVQPGQNVSVCQKYGMIKFGSRVDIFLPGDVVINVKIGDKVKGGETILGRWQ